MNRQWSEQYKETDVSGQIFTKEMLQNSVFDFTGQLICKCGKTDFKICATINAECKIIMAKCICGDIFTF